MTHAVADHESTLGSFVLLRLDVTEAESAAILQAGAPSAPSAWVDGVEPSTSVVLLSAGGVAGKARPRAALLSPAASTVLQECLASTSTAPASVAVRLLAGAQGLALVHRQLPDDFESTVQTAGQSRAAGSNRIDRQRQAAAALASLQRRAAAIAKTHRSDQTEWAKRNPGFGAQAAAAGSSYAGGQELHSLAGATRFHAWMAALLTPAVGRDVLEVGAGIGTMTKALAAAFPQSKILSIEPDPALYPQLAARVAGLGVDTATLSSLELEPSTHSFDTILYVNVLEHIEDHVGELRRALTLLRPGGHVGIIVPALPQLYGSLDAKTGHYRRYQKAALRSVVETAGFRVEEISYFDTVGVAPYWVSVKLGSMPALDDRTTAVFDRLMVPLSRGVRRVWKGAPIGKNLLVIASKS